MQIRSSPSQDQDDSAHLSVLQARNLQPIEDHGTSFNELLTKGANFMGHLKSPGSISGREL